MSNSLPWVALGALGVALAVNPTATKNAAGNVVRGAKRAANAIKPQSKQTVPYSPRALEPYRALVTVAAVGNGVRETLLAALVMTESSGNPNAKSPVNTELLNQPWFQAVYHGLVGFGVFGVGRPAAYAFGWSREELARAHGLTQVLGATAFADLGYRGKPAGLLVPKTSLEYGARLLAAKIRKYRSRDRGEYLALIAYNGGDGAVRNVLNGVPVPESTQYAARVQDWEARIKRGDA